MLPTDEIQSNVNDRRSFLKLLAAAPLFATIGTRSLASYCSRRWLESDVLYNVYTRLGVRPLINARGTWTYLCGSLELPGERNAPRKRRLIILSICLSCSKELGGISRSSPVPSPEW